MLTFKLINTSPTALRYDSRLRNLLRRLTLTIFDLTPPPPATHPHEHAKIRMLLQMEVERGAAEVVCKGVEEAVAREKDLRKKDGGGGEDEVEKRISLVRWVGVGVATVTGGVAVGLTGGEFFFGLVKRAQQRMVTHRFPYQV